MKFNEILETYNVSMAEVSKRYGIPYKTLQNWKVERTATHDYVLDLLERAIKEDKKM